MPALGDSGGWAVCICACACAPHRKNIQRLSDNETDNKIQSNAELSQMVGGYQGCRETLVLGVRGEGPGARQNPSASSYQELTCI